MKYLFFLTVLIISFSADAQRKDSIVYYDLVQLTNGYLIKGEIIAFDKEDGDLTFVDVDGKKYFLGKKDYDYFEEDKEFTIKVKTQSRDAADIHARKETEIEFTVGANVSYYQIGAELSGENTIYAGFGDRNHSPVCINLGVGKYFSRRHYVGIEIEAPIISTAKVVNANLKYKLQYDPFKGNIALYVPFGIEYSFLRSPIVPFERFPGGGFQDGEFDMTFNAVGLSVGHGFSYIMNNKKAISLEFALQKFLMVSEQFNDLVIPESELPIADYSLLGFRFGLKINI